MVSGEGKNVYTLGCDQIGTVKAVANSDGYQVKEVMYDSFGNVVSDTNPRLYLPVGFAGGAVCRWSGFVRLGFRDYAPAPGRFTSQDPLGDTGGDHDLYEYCVDDPVGAVDATGLDGEVVRNKYQYVYKSDTSPVCNVAAKALQFFTDCTQRDVLVSAGKDTEGRHSKGSAHDTGEAFDIGKKTNPELTRKIAEKCYDECFDTTEGYAQEESNHYHFQTRKGKGGATGFAKGVR